MSSLSLLSSLRERGLAALAPARTRFEALQPREQLALAAGAVVIALALVYLLVWEPAALLRQHRARDLETARSLASQIEVLGAQARLGHLPGPPVTAGASVALLTTIDQATKDGTLGKAPARLQPDGDDRARIWFEDLPFDALLRWIDALQTRYGVRIDDASIERRPAAGTVNARLTLVRDK
jgi:general secretion pathway protein M